MRAVRARFVFRWRSPTASRSPSHACHNRGKQTSRAGVTQRGLLLAQRRQRRHINGLGLLERHDAEGPSSRRPAILHLTGATGRHAIGRDSIIKTPVLKQLSTTTRPKSARPPRRGTRTARNRPRHQLLHRAPSPVASATAKRRRAATIGSTCSSGRREQPLRCSRRPPSHRRQDRPRSVHQHTPAQRVTGISRGEAQPQSPRRPTGHP